MKSKVNGWRRLLILSLALIVLITSSMVVMTFAADEIEVIGAMTTIKSTFNEKYLAQSTVRMDDNYVGTVQYTAYYDQSKGTIKTGYEGTPVIVYTVNHPGITRIGTDSDTTIIQSMLDRGYVVIVLDYLNNPNAVSPAIDYSSQTFRTKLVNGQILTNTEVFPAGNYRENFLAPAGYNVLLNQVFWEIDKHSAEGTLEKIVENWNSDFRATKGKNLIKWVHTDGTRKAVQNDLDGNAPVWYDSTGKVSENGEYTYIKFTKAEKVTDCVDPDGSFIDMNLYMNIVYPTSPVNEVPVMALANSSGYPTTSVTGKDIRPHSCGFLYNGYVNVVFDYLWQPMARSASWGYYDGSQGNTGDHMNYGLMMYNDKLVNTAAMRYLRYISLSNTAKYNFDLDAFGVYGNSKGGWFSFLGEAKVNTTLVNAEGYDTEDKLAEAIDTALTELVPDRYYNGHHGETRYQAKTTEFTYDNFTVKAGTRQPWLTYNGKEIISGCQLTNACNGSQQEDITEGHSPIFISGNMTDDYNAAFGYSVDVYNICRELNIPLLHFEVPIGHTLTSGTDMNYNVDTYAAYFNYVNYYLKNAPITVSHVSPMNNAADVKVTDKITVYLTGTASLSDIESITVTAGGTAVSGSWESSFGGTTWTFTPSSLSGSTVYTVTVPADFKGTNGVKMGKAYTTSFFTEFDTANAAEISTEYFTAVIPQLTSGNAFSFRFMVANDAANVAELYAVDSVGSTSGEYLGQAVINGCGSYEIDITDYAARNVGNSAVFYLKTKATGSYDVFTKDIDGVNTVYDPFDTYAPAKNSYVTFTTGAQIKGETALEAVISAPVNKNNISYYYDNVTRLFTYSNITGGSKTDVSNMGRRYVISFDVYDTANRALQIRLNTMTKRTEFGTIDYDHIVFTVNTKANEWTTVEFTYDVYEPKYGFASDNNTQSLAIYLSPDGDTNAPVYLNGLRTREIVTDVNVISASVAEKKDGTGLTYTPAVSTSPFAIYNGESKIGEYATWNKALAAYVSGYTIKLQSDYVLTDSDLSDAIGKFSTVNIDLGSYTLRSENTKNSLIWAKATDTAITSVNVKGGAILLGRTPLVTYGGSSAAGSGKTFNVNLDGTYVGFIDNAFATEIISGTATESGVFVNANVNLNECTIDLPDRKHAKDAFDVFAAPSASTLSVKYEVTGGTLKLTSQRWATVSKNANIVEFSTDGNGNYTKLVMPRSNEYAVTGSYLTSGGYATFKADTTADNLTTYTLISADNSTRYGIITDDYVDASKYPFLVFKDGNLVSGHDNFAAAVTAATNLLKGNQYTNSQAEILLRTNHTTTSEPAFNASAGTILIDLGNNTLTRGKLIVNAVVNSNTVFDYATGVTFKNGRIEMTNNVNSDGVPSASVIGATHCLATTDKVKTFNVTFEDITFGFADGYNSSINSSSLLWSVWQNSHNTNTVTNLNFNDCVFDFTKNAPAGNTLIWAATDKAQFNVGINGGEIKGDASAFKMISYDASDSVILGKNANGEYLAMSDEEGSAPVKDNFLCDDGKYRNFQFCDGAYKLLENDLITPYGEIPAEYGASTFVLFSDRSFVGAYDTWKAATTAAGGLLKNAPSKKAQLLMRKDYTNTNDPANGGAFNTMNGELTIDLGNHTFTRSKVIFDFYYYASNSDTVNVIIKNGTLLTTGGAIFANQVNCGGQTTEKTWNVTVENVTLGYAQGATRSGESFFATWTNNKDASGASVAAGSIKYGSKLNLTLNDCTIDLLTVEPPYTVDANDSTKVTYSTLFDFSDNNSYNLLDTALTINGGEILAKDLSKVNLWSLNSGTDTDSVTFGKYDGKYTTLKTPTTAAYQNVHYTGSFNTAEGTMYFIEMEDDGTNSFYELGKMTFDGYGTSNMTSKMFSAVDFPFLVFMDGTCKAGYGSWREAIDGAKGFFDAAGEESKTVSIVTRRNYTLTKAKDSGSNFNSARGKIVLDLMGYTITNTDNYFIDVYINYSTNTSLLGFTSSIEIKNGTLLNGRNGYPMIPIGHINSNSSYGAKQFSFTFTDITFKVTNGGSQFITEWTGGTHIGNGVDTSFVFNGCTFDFTGAANGSAFINISNTYSSSSVAINGGTIIADDFSKYTLFKKNNEDVGYVAADANGNYPIIRQLASAAAPTVSYKNAKNTTITFAKISVNGLYTDYLAGEPIYVKYGYVPFTYHSITDYPFVAFDKDGNFLAASPYLYGANNSSSVMNVAKEHMKANVWDGTGYGNSPRSALILMRRDYSMASNETFNNLAQVQGILTIDLNGFTLTTHGDRPLFPSSIKPWSGSGDASVFGTQFDVIDGKIKLGGKTQLITFEAWKGDWGIDVSGKKFIYNFTNVEFIASDMAENVFTNYTVSGATPDAIGNPELIFNDCTFDMTKAKSGAVLFNLGNGKVHTTVTVIGGEIVSGSTDIVIYTKNEATTSEITFGKIDGGNYTAWILPKGAALPDGEYNITNGTAVFVKVNEGITTDTYRLRDKALSDITFVPKMSISLSRDLIMNVYIPSNGLVKFTFDGVEYADLSAIAGKKITLDDGNDYYLLTVALPSDTAARSIELNATVDIGNGEASAKFTFSIPKYAAKVLDTENSTDADIALVKSVLAYVKAAYIYFNESNTDTEIARVSALIDSIIGSDYKADPKVESTDAEITEGLSGATFVLDETPSMRFFLSDGQDATKYAFYIDGKPVSAKVSEDGMYIDIDVYAYALCETVTYTIDGEDGGRYYIGNYYSYISDDGYTDNDKEELITLTKCFWNYLQCARAYRDSVIEE